MCYSKPCSASLFGSQVRENEKIVLTKECLYRHNRTAEENCNGRAILETIKLFIDNMFPILSLYSVYHMHIDVQY